MAIQTESVRETKGGREPNTKTRTNWRNQERNSGTEKKKLYVSIELLTRILTNNPTVAICAIEQNTLLVVCLSCAQGEVEIEHERMISNVE